MPGLTKLRIAFLKIRQASFVFLSSPPKNVLSFNMVLYLCKQENRASRELMGHQGQAREDFLLLPVVTTSQEGKCHQAAF